MDNWFTIEQIDRDTFSISEYKHWEETHCYLLCGEKYAILIDTGLGVSNIRKIVDSLTKLPVMTVTTHVHHHRGSYTSPALAAASYPFVDLPPGNTLRCKLFPFSKFIQIQSQLHFSRLFSNRLIAWSSLLHYN